MIQSLKLYFDACCSTRLPKEILAFYVANYPTLETRHLFQDERPDAKDPVWLQKIQGQGWIVVTCDRGRDRSTFPLPVACEALGITNIAFTPTVQKRGVTAQKNALAAVWEALFLLDRFPPGTQLRLGENGITKDGFVRYALRLAANKGEPKLPPPA